MTNHTSEKMTNPYQNSATAKLIADRIRDLPHRKTQAEISSEAGFPSANMMTSGGTRHQSTGCRPSPRLWKWTRLA